MATISMASAACGFALTPHLTPTANSSRTNVFLVCNKNKNSMSSRMVVRAAEGEPPAPVGAPPPPPPPPPAAKPPPIGPKRGTKVKILRKESYWYKGVNYANVSTNNYALDEIQEVVELLVFVIVF
ncbi:photosystem I reaction center subunit IV A, chloroplastic-like [Actinidia eriantha]|uniref:photosystem I reaction center subunit IV A, chloroplastic-like n=1 Tax=Actinidia eriantha TaxID=165200 RepID=UPI0025830B17|nr:photosystem I reaction center subunit IV A, chloroplastic-like [Actinidia eriantha]